MLGKAIERARTLVHRRILQVIRASFGGTSQDRQPSSVPKGA